MASMYLIGQAAGGRCAIFCKLLARGQPNALRCIGTSPPLLRAPHITGENRLRRQDGISEQFQLIYKSKAASLVYFVKSAAVVTMFGIAASWIYCYVTDAAFDPSINGLLLLPSSINEMQWLSWMAVGINIFVYRISHMCLHRIYRHEKKYIAVIPGLIPQLNSKLAFNRGELMEPAINSWSPLQKIAHKIGDRRVIIIPQRFRTPAEYHDAMDNPANYVRRKNR